mgnify:CR=1 FL=1
MKIMLALMAFLASFTAVAQTPRDVSRDMARLNGEMFEYAVKVYAVKNPEKPDEGMGTGSGQLIRSTDGVARILTNHHVVGHLAQSVYVHFDGEPFAQRVNIIGRDSLVDLALLEAPSPLPRRAKPIPIARTPLLVGQQVYAIGYPSGSRTISSGVINSLTSPHEEAGIGLYFTHQAPISPGSSGGLLVRFNAFGQTELVGINTQVTVLGGLIANVSFSIRPEVIERMLEKLETGQVIHAFAGFVVTGTDRANPYLYELGTKQSYPPQRPGIMVMAVAPNSPAGRSGIQRGDMIWKLEASVDGRFVDLLIRSATELRDTIFFKLAPGTLVRLSTTRGTQEVQRNFTLERVPETAKLKEE